MPFRIKEEARTWFQYIRPKMEYDFDYYYLCLMVGLATRQKTPDLVQADTTEITDDFPGEYRSRGRIIISLFLKIELDAAGISLNNRSDLNEYIHTLINPNSVNKLSSEGDAVLNKYADRGFEILKEWFGDKPRNLEIFLPLMKQRLSEAITENSTK